MLSACSCKQGWDNEILTREGIEQTRRDNKMRGNKDVTGWYQNASAEREACKAKLYLLENG
jgi:hypothetical protein